MGISVKYKTKNNKEFEVINFEINTFESKFFEFLTENTTIITDLDFCCGKIGDKGAKVLAEALKVNKSITELNINGNNISAKGAKVLAEALKVNKTITHLDLSSNGIGDEGAKALARALEINTSITEFNLSHNGIEAGGAKALAETLKVNKTITHLNLRYNNIEAGGAKALAETLKVNTSITQLDLSGNNIEDEGVKALAEALKGNTSIVQLNINGNKINDEGAKALVEALKRNATITEFYIDYNDYNAEIFQGQMDFLLGQNRSDPEGAVNRAVAYRLTDIFSDKELCIEELRGLTKLLLKADMGKVLKLFSQGDVTDKIIQGDFQNTGFATIILNNGSDIKKIESAIKDQLLVKITECVHTIGDNAETITHLDLSDLSINQEVAEYVKNLILDKKLLSIDLSGTTIIASISGNMKLTIKDLVLLSLCDTEVKSIKFENSKELTIATLKKIKESVVGNLDEKDNSFFVNDKLKKFAFKLKDVVLNELSEKYSNQEFFAKFREVDFTENDLTNAKNGVANAIAGILGQDKDAFLTDAITKFKEVSKLQADITEAIDRNIEIALSDDYYPHESDDQAIDVSGNGKEEDIDY